MKAKLSPFLIGSFVLGTLVLIVVALLSFRSLNVFATPERFVTYFNESVQGLDVGSPVKLRGVRVGRVADIQVHYDAKSLKSQVAVIADLDKSVIRERSGRMMQLRDRATFERLIEEGLRAKIDLVGITGLQYVELDFVNPEEFPAPHRDSKDEYPVVPALRSGMSELVTDLSKIANSVNKVDFAGLSRELQSLLATVNRQVTEVDLKALAAKVTSAAAAIEAIALSEEAKAAITNVNKTAFEVQKFVATLTTHVDPIQMEFVQTLRSFHLAAESVHKFLGPQNALGEETVLTLQQLKEAAESLQRLMDLLERNPSILLTGKKRPDKQP